MSSSLPQVGQGPACLLCLVSNLVLWVAEPLGRPGKAGAAQGATMRDQLDLWIQLAAAVICVHPPLYIWLCWTFPLFQKCPHGAQAKREEGTFVWVFFWKPLSWWTRNLLHHSPTCKQIRYLHHLPLMMELASDGPMSCWERVTVCKCFIGHHQPSLLEIKYKWSQMLRA